MNPTKEMVDRFLQWPMPNSVCADLCATKQGQGRNGTNLLTATEAQQMLEFVLGPPPVPNSTSMRLPYDPELENEREFDVRAGGSGSVSASNDFTMPPHLIADGYVHRLRTAHDKLERELALTHDRVARLEEQNAALGTRVSQFQFCINRVAEALGNVCCGGVDSSPENQLSDPHSTTRVLVDAIEKLKVRANDAWVRGYTKAMDEKDFIASLKNRDGL